MRSRDDLGLISHRAVVDVQREKRIDAIGAYAAVRGREAGAKL